MQELKQLNQEAATVFELTANELMAVSGGFGGRPGDIPPPPK